MDTAFYAGLTTETDGAGAGAELQGTVRSAAACGGPWSADLQHGGPPSALLVRLAEQLAATAAGRFDLAAARIAAEFLAPVPVAPLEVAARVLRLARSAVLISAELAVDGRPCLQARVWLIAEAGTPVMPQPGAERGCQDKPAHPAALPDFGMDGFPYAEHLEWRTVSGRAREPGPAAVWVRARVPLLAGERPSTLQRLVLVADSASGVSSLLDWDDWSFANIDLDVHLMRQSQDDWLLMEAVSEVGPGIGLARSSLSDRAGLLGAGLQTLLIRSRRD
ncbi:MAG TPA: thioesterase family protein [Jatrophihabitans sp.]|uniref:thioesterase family protein n=1 Tax=Jatrophihabitans sp. TaxID=1932789 RepID=UPI002F02B016